MYLFWWNKDSHFHASRNVLVTLLGYLPHCLYIFGEVAFRNVTSGHSRDNRLRRQPWAAQSWPPIRLQHRGGPRKWRSLRQLMGWRAKLEGPRAVAFLRRGGSPPHQLRGSGSAVTYPCGLWGEAPATWRFRRFHSLQSRSWYRLVKRFDIFVGSGLTISAPMGAICTHRRWFRRGPTNSGATSYFFAVKNHLRNSESCLEIGLAL